MSKKPPRRSTDKLHNKERTPSSRAWLARHVNDPYVQAAKQAGWRSRAAFKLLEINDKYKILHPAMRVVDLGAAPGGWAQVAASMVGERGKVVALDILPISPLAGVITLVADFYAPTTVAALREALGGKAQLVLSDMAPNTTGVRDVDHLRIMALAEAALDFAEQTLSLDGAFVCKLFQGATQQDFVAGLKQRFKQVRYFKPQSSRQESSELYLVAQGFKGALASASGSA